MLVKSSKNKLRGVGLTGRVCLNLPMQGPGGYSFNRLAHIKTNLCLTGISISSDGTHLFHSTCRMAQVFIPAMTSLSPALASSRGLGVDHLPAFPGFVWGGCDFPLAWGFQGLLPLPSVGRRINFNFDVESNELVSLQTSFDPGIHTRPWQNGFFLQRHPGELDEPLQHSASWLGLR